MYLLVRSQMVLFGYVWSCMALRSYAQFLCLFCKYPPFLQKSKEVSASKTTPIKSTGLFSNILKGNSKDLPTHFMPATKLTTNYCLQHKFSYKWLSSHSQIPKAFKAGRRPNELGTAQLQLLFINKKMLIFFNIFLYRLI